MYHPDYIQNLEDAISLEQLSGYPVMMLGRLSATSSFLHEQFLKHSIELVPSIEISSNDLLIDLAEIGLGIAFVPDFCISENRNLKILKIKECIPKRELLAAYDETTAISEAADFFMRQLIHAEKNIC